MTSETSGGSGAARLLGHLQHRVQGVDGVAVLFQNRERERRHTSSSGASVN